MVMVVTSCCAWYRYVRAAHRATLAARTANKQGRDMSLLPLDDEFREDLQRAGRLAVVPAATAGSLGLHAWASAPAAVAIDEGMDGSRVWHWMDEALRTTGADHPGAQVIILPNEGRPAVALTDGATTALAAARLEDLGVGKTPSWLFEEGSLYGREHIARAAELIRARGRAAGADMRARGTKAWIGTGLLAAGATGVLAGEERVRNWLGL